MAPETPGSIHEGGELGYALSHVYGAAFDNAGWSSLKLAVLDGDEQVAATTVEHWQGAGHVEPIADFLDGCEAITAVGHRVVRGGSRDAEPVVVDDEVVAYLDSITDLAPQHQPRALAGIREVSRLLDLPGRSQRSTPASTAP